MGFNIQMYFSLEAPFIFWAVAQVQKQSVHVRSSQPPLPVYEEQFGKSGALVSLVMLTVGEETQTESISINFSMALAQKRLGCEIASVLSKCPLLVFVVYP